MIILLTSLVSDSELTCLYWPVSAIAEADGNVLQLVTVINLLQWVKFCAASEKSVSRQTD